MQLNIDSETMAGIASKAIFDSLTEENRDTLVKQAIESLLTPEDKLPGIRYGQSKPKSPLQNAFDVAIRDAAFKVVKEKVADDPQINAELEKLIGPLLMAAMEAEGKNYDSTLAYKLGEALGAWLSKKAMGE